MRLPVLSLRNRKRVGVGIIIVVSLLGFCVPSHLSGRQVWRQVDDGLDARRTLQSSIDHPTYDAKVEELRQAHIPTDLSLLYRKPPPASRNAAFIYLKMASMKPDALENETTGRLRPAPTAADWEQARQFLKQHQSLVAMADAAARKPECFIPRVDTGASPVGIMFPELAQIRRADRIVTIKSRLMAHDGHGVAAVAEQALGLNVAKHADCDGTLISWLVQIACYAIALNGMQHIMTDTNGDPAVATAVRNAIESNWQPLKLSDPLKFETGFGNAICLYVWKNPESLGSLYGSGDDTSNGDTSDGTNSNAADDLPYKGRLWNPFMDANSTYFLDYMERSIAVADLPYPQAKPKLAAIVSEIDSTSHPTHKVMASILCPDASKTLVKGAMSQALADVTRCAAAVFVWKSQHGRFPDSLGDATSIVPRDPFDLKPIRYRRDGMGFVIYSVGETGKYDGGAFDDKVHHEIVFRWPVQPQ